MSAGELVDVLDRQDANSSRPILKEWVDEMGEEGMPFVKPAERSD
ncbi:hypothetical protein LJR245_002331 [Rhizobium leguminosarum]